VQKSENGFLSSGDIERCIRKVMDAERKDEYQSNAANWMQKPKEARQEGGSSDINIVQFSKKYK
jgi:hypothetical protein